MQKKPLGITIRKVLEKTNGSHFLFNPAERKKICENDPKTIDDRFFVNIVGRYYKFSQDQKIRMNFEELYRSGKKKIFGIGSNMAAKAFRNENRQKMRFWLEPHF
jgi:hypothetical protein